MALRICTGKVTDTYHVVALTSSAVGVASAALYGECYYKGTSTKVNIYKKNTKTQYYLSKTNSTGNNYSSWCAESVRMAIHDSSASEVGISIPVYAMSAYAGMGGSVTQTDPQGCNPYSFSYNNKTYYYKHCLINSVNAEKSILFTATANSGYTFKHWVKETSRSVYSNNANIYINTTTYNDENLEAVFEANSYTVTFNGNGGNTPSPQSSTGTSITAASCTRTGYALDGWYDSASGGNKITFPYAPTGDITLYAHWTANQYTVTFNANGHGTPSVNSKTVTYASTYGDLATIDGSADHYAFDGWFTAASGGEQVTSSTTVSITQAQTLYAHWHLYRQYVYFNGNGATGGSMSAQTFYYGTNQAYTQNAFTRTNYKFLGWSRESTGSVHYADQTTVYYNPSYDGETTTLYAIWEKKVCTVWFNPNGGSLDDNIRVVPLGDALNHNANLFPGDGSKFSNLSDLLTYDKINNRFRVNHTNTSADPYLWPVGWANTLSGNDYKFMTDAGRPFVVSIWVDSCVSAGADNIAFGETYSNHQSQLSYCLRTHSALGHEEFDVVVNAWSSSYANHPLSHFYIRIPYHNTANFTFKYGVYAGRVKSTVSKSATPVVTPYEGYIECNLPLPSRTGYDLAGWYNAQSGGTQYVATTIVSTPIELTLYAHWTPHKYYIDVYNGVATNPTSSTQVNFDQVYTATAPTRNDYIFQGWKVTSNLNTTTAKWGTNSIPTTSIASADTLCVNEEAGNVYFVGLNPTEGARVAITAMWKRRTYQVTVSNTMTNMDVQWDANVICNGSSFTDIDGTKSPQINRAVNYNSTLGYQSETFTFYSGETYTIKSYYTNASVTDGTFRVLKSWGGYTATRVNSGTDKGVFTASHTMGRDANGNFIIENNGTAQTWTPACKSVTTAKYSPFNDIVPHVTVSFHNDDTAGSYLKATASNDHDGITFNQWANVSGTTITPASSNPAKFQVSTNDVSMTANYVKKTLTVQVQLDPLAAAACGSSLPTVTVFTGTEPQQLQVSVEVLYKNTVNLKITGIPQSLSFGGWYVNGVLKSANATTQPITMLENTVFVAKLRANITLSKDITEATEGTVEGNLVLNNTVYYGDQCNKDFLIGDSISIGVTLLNDDTHHSNFINWTDVTDGDNPVITDYGQNEQNIVVTGNRSLRVYLMDSSQQYYVAFYNRNINNDPNTIESTLGQLTPSGTSYNALQKMEYFANVIPVSITTSGATLYAKPNYVEGGTYYEWVATAGSSAITHTVRFTPDDAPQTPGNGTWSYSKTGVAARTISGNFYSNNSISIPAVGSEPAVTLGHVDNTFSGSSYNNGSFYRFDSVQKMQLSIVKKGALDYSRCKRFLIGATTEGSVYSYEQTVVSLINQNFVFVADWGTPTTYTLKASLASIDDHSKGEVDLGGYVKSKSYNNENTTGQSEANIYVATWAKAKNGYDFLGWYEDKASAMSSVPVFNTAASYVMGDFVKYNGNTYKCIATHSGAWDATHFESILPDDPSVPKPFRDVEEFGEGVDYNVGDFVRYNGILYKCTAIHPHGAWNAAHFTGPKSTEAYYEFDMPSNDYTLYAKFASASVSLYKWEGSSSNLPLKWESKVYALSKPVNLNSIRIDATGYPIGVTRVDSYSSPDTVATSTVVLSNNTALANQTMRRLPARRPERFFKVSVESTNEIDAIIIGTSGEGLAT